MSCTVDSLCDPQKNSPRPPSLQEGDVPGLLSLAGVTPALASPRLPICVTAPVLSCTAGDRGWGRYREDGVGL